ncbi:HotDog domain-containing protein [Halteromyces radiatus]|uniref:HotDog domain-containing protein n=1 Tax=Halteromyces radiatus TaxID=101107 RepID=UPI00221EDBF6|nr:HotDog domain-containing protein [Halteromyces radiatus]KAI8081569.1 HotDog domain-containing protein [Halteromyces radiatus]
MPRSTFPSVISFSNQREPVTTPPDEFANYGEHLANAVDVQEIDVNLYMSKELWLPLGARGAFGGQIVAQALRAAFHTVGKTFQVHSLHSYFILPGDVSMPVLYEVIPLRDGRSFATRFVRAKQRGKAIFVCSCSFTKDYDVPTVEHQSTMPKVPAPENLKSAEELMEQELANNNLSAKYRDYLQKRLDEDRPVDYREVDPKDIDDNDRWVSDNQNLSRSARWCVTRGKLSDDPQLHACVIAYISDSGFLLTAARATGIGRRGFGMMASLDHSIYFHKNMRADEWFLYDMHSPRSGDGRGVSFGRIYTKDGVLAATTSQEGLIRLTKTEQEKLRNKANQDNIGDSKL